MRMKCSRFPSGQGRHAGQLRVGTLGLRVQVMGRALDQHAPAFARHLIELVDLEGDAVLGMGDARPQVFVSSAPSWMVRNRIAPLCSL